MGQAVGIHNENYAKYPAQVFTSTKPHQRYYEMWNFKMILRCGDDNKGQLHFTSDGLCHHNFWKILATVEFRFKDDEQIVQVEEVSNNPDQTIHYFDCTKLLPEGETAIEFTIHFKQMDGFGVKARPWNFYSPNAQTDVAIVADGKRIYQNKQILAYHSTYFNSLFFGDFAEKNKDEVELKDVSANDLVSLFDALHGSQFWRLGNVEKILEFADRFDVPDVMSKATQFLMWITYIDKHKRLLLSDKYRLAQLQSRILSQWTDADYEVFTKGTDNSLRQLSSQTIAAVVKFWWNKPPQ